MGQAPWLYGERIRLAGIHYSQNMITLRTIWQGDTLGGSYGDPAILSADLIRSVNSYALGHTAYTTNGGRTGQKNSEANDGVCRLTVCSGRGTLLWLENLQSDAS